MKPMDYNPVMVFRALGDQLRLAALLLVRDRQKLCVCELTAAFGVPQPKMSRHLATLRDVGLLVTERRGQWIYYSLNPGIPRWLIRVLEETAGNNAGLIETPRARLQAMADRPSVQCL